MTNDLLKIEICSGKYLEFGEYEGNLYGTKLDSVRAVMRSGKTCVLSIHPQSLKSIRFVFDTLPFCSGFSKQASNKFRLTKFSR